jgi:phenylpropionate dioxygenase-like ring-hydroxylating dioxygenase large terminal subunit
MTQLLSSAEPVDTSGVPFAVRDRGFIPKQRYYDRGFFELENERLWPRVWQMACRLEEIPDVGDYAEYSVASYSVIVVRTGVDEIKAYENACRHRATQLALGCGRFGGGQIVCPFHGWRWNLDGSPSSLYGREGFDEHCLDPEDLRLIECQVGIWAGCVFINMDPDAPPLMEALQPLPGILDPLRLADMRSYWWKGARLKANWKIVMEAFMEAWHVRQSHPELTIGNPEGYNASFLIDYHSDPNGNMHFHAARNAEMRIDSGMDAGLSEVDATIEFSRIMLEGLESLIHEKDLRVMEGLRAVKVEPGQFQTKLVEALYAWNTAAGIRLPDPNPDVLGYWGGVFFAFPNYIILPQFGNAVIYRFRPDSADSEQSYFEAWAVTLYPEGENPGRPTFDGVIADDDPRWPLVFRQDFMNTQRQQRGVRTRRYKALRMARRWEDQIANMHVHLDTYLAG